MLMAANFLSFGTRRDEKLFFFLSSSFLFNGGFLLSCSFCVYTHVNYARINKIDTILDHERKIAVNVKFENRLNPSFILSLVYFYQSTYIGA